MLKTKRMCIIGWGASGTSLAWLTALGAMGREAWSVTLLHDEPRLGGHSHSVPVTVGGDTVPVDIGVQFVSPTLYPHVFAMLGRREFRERVILERMPPLRFVAAFTGGHNYVNDPAYTDDSRFARGLSAQARADARELTRDIGRCLFTRIDGAPAAGVTLETYLEYKPHLRRGDFFSLGFMPLLSVINGYTAHDILQTRLGDLFPIVSKLPLMAGPLIPFEKPGVGWYRFRDGSTAWIEAMADFAREAGARIVTGTPARSITPSAGGQVTVVAGADGAWAEAFDAVVLTTDMDTNRLLLDHADNLLWDRQAPYIGADRFPLLPGVCFIHQDDTILAPHLREGVQQDVQFTGAYAWAPDRENAYGLPYDLHSTYATHLVHNAFPHLKERCYVTMYAEAQETRWPDPARVLHKKEWRHGRWMSSFMKEGKAQLHRIQGLGGVWFAGNNTTFDAEEGAVLSALGVAERLLDGFKSPFGGLGYVRRPAGALLYREFIKKVMFPPSWQVPV